MARSLRRNPKKDEIPLSFSRRQELKKRAASLEADGLALGDIRMGEAPNRFSMCLIRAILVFMAVLGTIGGLASAFALPFSLPAVLIGFAILSTFSAFLYYNKITFYTGYVLVFLGFVVFSFRYYWYINSGYQAFMNEVYNQYSDFFHMLSIREATEFITDRYLTVTAAMLFLGWFLSILLNITIAGYMNLAETFLLTFLPLQVAFYIDLRPSLPYLILLLAVYISVAVLQRSGNYTLPFRHNRAQHFETKRIGKNVHHIYLASSHGMLRIAAGATVLATIFLLISNALFSHDFSTKLVSNPVKDKTDQYVQAIVQNGLTSLLNRYQATGGLAHGKLGGVGSVNPDFETDLTIRYVPYAVEPLYLKAYTGITYQNNTFFPNYYQQTPSSLSEDIMADDLLQQDNCAPHLTGYRDEDPAAVSDTSEDLFGKMWINNIDADPAYMYRPYYTFASTTDRLGASLGISNDVLSYAKEHYPDAFSMLDEPEEMEEYTETPGKENYEVLYLPYESRLHYGRNPEITEEYEKFVYDTCLQVPKELSEPLKTFWKTELADAMIGAISIRDTQLENAVTEEDRRIAEQDFRLRLALALKYYYIENFRYTMAPGATPFNKDTVEYFLTVQKRGYCAHFASSAALLLRRAGIPTRYVEGYMITTSEIADSLTVSTDTDDWQIGESTLGRPALVEIDVPDASAHAWIEIYIDGYGWIPYEMTPPSGDDDRSDGGNNFFAFLSNLITPTERNTGDTANNESDPSDTVSTTGRNLLSGVSTLSYLFRPVLTVAGAFLFILLLLPLVRLFRRKLRLQRFLREGQYSDALLLHFEDLQRVMRSRHLLTAQIMSIREITGHLVDLFSDREEVKSLPPLRDLLWTAAYASGSISEADYQNGRSILAKLISALPKKTLR